MKQTESINYKKLFDKLSEPISCGVIINGVRHQKSNGEWSSERIFVLSDELHKEKPNVMFRTYFDSDASWRGALKRYISSDRAFKHPKLKLICIEKDMVTSRNLDFDLNFEK